MTKTNVNPASVLDLLICMYIRIIIYIYIYIYTYVCHYIPNILRSHGNMGQFAPWRVRHSARWNPSVVAWSQDPTGPRGWNEWHGGFLSHGGNPSYHPIYQDGIFHEINRWGIPGIPGIPFLGHPKNVWPKMEGEGFSNERRSFQDPGSKILDSLIQGLSCTMVKIAWSETVPLFSSQKTTASLAPITTNLADMKPSQTAYFSWLDPHVQPIVQKKSPTADSDCRAVAKRR